MIVLDTTILVYAVGDEHPLRAPCRAIVDMIGDGGLSATTTVEVVQEFTHVRTRRRGREDAAARAGDFATLLAPLLRPDDEDLRRGLELFKGSQLGAFDAVLAAVVVRNAQTTAIVSADGGFATIEGLTRLDPAQPDVLDRLAANAL